MSIDTDPVRLRITAADPASPGTQPPETVMNADAVLAIIEQRSSYEATSATPERPARRVTTSPRSVAAFVAAVVVVGLAIGIAALLRGTMDEVVGAPAVSTTATPSTTPAPPTTAALTPEPTTLRWKQVLTAGPRHLYFVRVASDGERVVAVSAESDTADESAWTSLDGRVWERMEATDLLDAGVLIAGPEGFMTVGPAAVGSTEAGLTEVAAVASGETGWVAVGRNEIDGRVWVSDDAASWLRGYDSVFADAWPLDVVAGGPGFVAVGSFHGLGEGGRERAAVWITTDGRTWHLVEPDALAGETRLGSVIVDPADGSLIAFGVRSVWRSSDGVDWTAIHDRSFSIWLSQPSPSAEAVWVGDTLVAGGGDAAFSLWISTDRGATWERHDPNDPVFAARSIDGLIVHRGTVIATGGDMYARINVDDTAPWVDPDAPVIWIGELSE